MEKSSGQQRKLALSADLQGSRVLLVDDNKNARQVLAELLVNMGLKVEQAESGRAAIDAVNRAEESKNQFEIIILDWQMPGMDGIDAAKQLKALPLVRLPHRMLLTSYGSEEVIRDAEAAGIEDVLIKPASASVLFDSVVRMLGGVVDEQHFYGGVPSDTFLKLNSIKGANVLLVEDNELNQEVATELLTDAGFIVDLAENGQLALERLNSMNYDIVLMDMQMPVMDGVTATQAIRKQSRFQHIPIVAMTANAMQGDRDRCMAAGMNDHVAKPIEPEELWKALLKWIKPHPASVAKSVELTRAVLPAEGLPVIEGLDTVNGLRRVMGKQSLYLSMLRTFASGEKLTTQMIVKSLDERDWITAERLAHTLKGLAGNIGAGNLQLLAEKLEIAIKQKRPRAEINLCLHVLNSPLSYLIDQLEIQLPAEQPKRVVAVDLARLREVCDKLALLLADDDSQASDLMNENSDLLNAAFPAHYRQLSASMSAFDFETTLALLNESIKSLTEGNSHGTT
jgi:two-component system sensor histidine kinase/response regulator